MEKNFCFSVSGRQANLIDKWNKIHSYLCGLAQSFAYVKRSSNDPRLVCIGSELTGIHRHLNRNHPGLGGYHIGGVGLTRDEALIKAVGELHERYSQLIAEKVVIAPYKFDTLNNLQATNEPVLSADQLNYFTQDQFKRDNFPFKSFEPDQKIGWYRLSSITDKNDILWIPAQLLFIGYNLKKEQGEPWLNTAVTTGTATHSNKSQAILNAILELIQLDCTIGNWYSDGIAKQIEFDERLKIFNKILDKYAPHFRNHITFHYFEPPENWSNFNIACVYRRKDGYQPKIAIGLGSDLSLERAMYKAFLECYGVVIMLRYELLFVDIQKLKLDQCFDIDSNVCYHGVGSQYDFIDQKFSCKKTIRASQLPSDLILPASQQVEHMLSQLHVNGKRLFGCDITTPEAEAVGFYNYRVWSPDLLALCFPSAPWKNHKRFKDYGGITHELLHPFP